MATILTYTGKTVDLENPTVDMVDLRDIAHALSQINRFTGHTRRPYSVAEHSLLVSDFVPPHLQLAGLLHDASEAYLGDVSSPLKALLPEYKALEAKWMKVIEQKFGLPAMYSEVKHADAMALEAEIEVLLATNFCVAEAVELISKSILDLADMKLLLERPPVKPVEDLFLCRAHELMAHQYLNAVTVVSKIEHTLANDRAN